MKAVLAAFNQEKALVGAFSVIVQLHRLIDLRHYLGVLLPGGGVADVQGRVASIQLHGGAAVKVEPPHTAKHLQQHHPCIFFTFISCVITS